MLERLESLYKSRRRRKPYSSYSFLCTFLSIMISSPCLIFLLILLMFLNAADSLSFNFLNFPSNMAEINFEEDSFSSGGVLQLTKNQMDASLKNSSGRASYSQPVPLWDAKTGQMTDFTTQFSFIMRANDPQLSGDGLSFFLAPSDSKIPNDSSGGYLALFHSQTAFDNTSNQIVAVEFDSFRNPWDPSADHVGINVNSIISVTNVSWRSSIKNGSTANAWISYNSTSQNLSVFLTYAKNPIFSGNSSLSYIIDLSKVLPEWIRIGFSAATGDLFETHNILQWKFESTLEVLKSSPPSSPPTINPGHEIETKSKKRSKARLLTGLLVGFVVLICGLGFLFLSYKRRQNKNSGNYEYDDNGGVDASIEFEQSTGPKRFTYRELSRATNNFAEIGKLGEGGFGGVYKGLLSESNIPVAVKRVSKTSKQGKKEYISEVKVISRLRHRNLVQLIGWCHEQSELLLVYEYMPNGSLDSHLFGGKIPLIWTIRYKIALGLATALLYLHEEWEQCVVHRDIKSSNVMLDSNFNTKLGDFGLARLVDHDLGSQTTVLAGTMGYLAPECVMTGKASKESDVYSFGVVALEIACGRKPVEPKLEPSKVRLIEWVWELYGRGQYLEAVDKRLCNNFDERQMEYLIAIGLWCCHPDLNHRPSARQVISVLNFEAPLPSLPTKLPVPTYYAPPMDYASSSNGITHASLCSSSSCSTNTSMSKESTKALLK